MPPMRRNAGIIAWATMTETSLDVWQRMLAVNVTGSFLCAKAAIRRMSWSRVRTTSAPSVGGPSLPTTR